MSRNARMMIVIGIAVVTAALASLGVYMAIASRPVIAVEAPAVDVVVAAKEIDAGVLLTKADLEVIKWPESVPLAGAFSKVDEVVDRGLVAGVLKNEPITANKLGEPGAGAGLPPLIDKGMRAMSVRVNEVVGVAGFVTPGTRVDVLVTLSQGGGSVSRAVISNVEVLAAGTRYDDAEAKRQGKPIPSTVVTLMVRPEDAERIALAASEGQITLALRNPLDRVAVETRGVTTGQLMAAPSVPVPVTPPPRRSGPIRQAPPPPPSSPCSIEAFKAGKREVVPCM
jgi:pilus assembly protein CpaB